MKCGSCTLFIPEGFILMLFNLLAQIGRPVLILFSQMVAWSSNNHSTHVPHWAIIFHHALSQSSSVKFAILPARKKKDNKKLKPQKKKRNKKKKKKTPTAMSPNNPFIASSAFPSSGFEVKAPGPSLPLILSSTLSSDSPSKPSYTP